MGDCFVHGIMDGDAMYTRDSNGTRIKIKHDHVYLICLEVNREIIKVS